jgi:HSP20 family molecular chaperone IbpA
VVLLPKKKTVKGPEHSEEDSATVVTPDVCIDHDDAAYYIDFELPGIAKEHLDLCVGEQAHTLKLSATTLFTWAVLASPTR